MTKYEIGMLAMVILVAPHLSEGAAVSLGLIYLAIGFLLGWFERKEGDE